MSSKTFQTEIKSEREESPIVTPIQEIEEENQLEVSLETQPEKMSKEIYRHENLSKDNYPEELFNLATLADVSLAYAGQFHTPALTEQINQARYLNFFKAISKKKTGTDPFQYCCKNWSMTQDK